jgi:hypothetical protein
MISRAPQKWLAAVSAAAVAALAAGQAPQTPPPADGPALPPRYEVELIVFANRAFDPNEERFDDALNGFPAEPQGPLAAPPVFDDTTRDRPGAGAAPPPALDAAVLEALRVRPLRPEELKLRSEYRKLTAISAYEPLLHAGWVQPGLPEGEAPSFDLATLGVWNPRGTVRVHLGLRLLHITLDLTYAAAPGATPLGSDGLDELSWAPRYRLTATRGSRSGELHYFDHPAFGVLVRITPVPTPGANSSGRRPAA